MSAVSRAMASAVTTLLVGGCVTRTHTEIPPDAPFNSYGPIDPGRRQLGVGQHTALDFGNLWVVTARGVEPSTHWRHELVREGRRDGAAVVALYVEEPLMGGAAMTPFVVSHAVRPGNRKVVFVRDREGLHEVPVRAPPGD